MPTPNYTRVASLKTADDFLTYLDKVGAALPFDRELTPSLFDQPIAWSGGTIGNRFCILPMEGWDGTTDGRPTELTTRRWRNFGISGAKLLWGGEAVAVRHDGRANPNQLMINDQTLGDLEQLRSRGHRRPRRAFRRPPTTCCWACSSPTPAASPGRTTRSGSSRGSPTTTPCSTSGSASRATSRC